MATYTRQDIANLKDRIRAELPDLVKANPGTQTTPLELLYCDANPALVDQFGMSNQKWSVVQVRVNDIIQELRKSGEIVKHKGRYYHPDFDLSTLPAPKKKAKKKAKKATAPVEPVVEETVEVEPTPPVVEVEVEETVEVAPVEPVAEVEETVEPMVEVSVPSSVQVSTTTLEPVVVEQEPVDVQEEVEDTPVEPVEVQDDVEPTLEVEMPVEDNEETQEEETQEEETQEEENQEEEEETQPSYDLRELRKSASFDPLKITLKGGATGIYEVYRDMEARMIVLTQKGREDYVMIPVDVDQDRLEALKGLDKRYAPFALKAVADFDSERHHKDGCNRIVKALISCTHNCEHTDDFGGLAEPCPQPYNCPLQSIWGGVAIYVNPQDA